MKPISEMTSNEMMDLWMKMSSETPIPTLCRQYLDGELTIGESYIVATYVAPQTVLAVAIREGRRDGS